MEDDLGIIAHGVTLRRDGGVTQAADVAAVQGFYDAAVQWGAESLHAPRLWPEYHPGYYGAFVRDPDGNNVEAVFHGAAGLVPPPGGSG